MYLKVSLVRSVKRFNMKGKLAPRYILPFKILERHGEVAYQLELHESLSYVEFSYNNCYQKSLKMAPFEALYGRKCRTPLFWNQTGETQVFGPDVLRDVEEQVRMIRDNLRVTQS